MYTFTNITHKIGTKKILDKVTINIPTNKITMILGPSGAGKTTLLKLIGSRISSKGIKLNDRNITARALNTLTSFVYQHHNLQGEFTVNEYFNYTYNCKMSTMGNQSSQEEIDDLLRRLNIYDIKNRIIGIDGANLSGGQLKRFELGLELISRSDIILIDEPLSGLDSFNSTAIMEVLKEFKRTIVLSVHHPSSSILEYAEHIIILDSSSTFFEGSSAELIDYIRESGYTYNDSEKINCCEFVFNKILPNFDLKQGKRERFVYKKRLVESEIEIGHKIDKTPNTTRFTFAVLNLLKRSFMLFYKNYISSTFRVLQYFLLAAYFILSLEKTILKAFLEDIKQNSRSFEKYAFYESIVYTKSQYLTGFYLLTATLTASCCLSGNVGSTLFIKDFYLIAKENSNNYYTLVEYVFATIVFEVCFSLFFTVISYTIMFNFTGLQLGLRYKTGFILGQIPCVLLSLGFMMVISAILYNTYISMFVFLLYLFIVIYSFSTLFLDDDSSSMKISIFEKINPIRYGSCLAVKTWITKDTEENLSEDIIKNIYEPFLRSWQIFILSIGLFLFYSICAYFFFCWKARNTRG
ncbi:ABC transporter G family member 23 [Cucumispora dikerogammari]|nr:ABC transporter G family member 23 [Cucumispora dikerogammari]